MCAVQCAKARNSCTDRTAVDPSPTAAATRLVEPARTSPTAKQARVTRLERQRPATEHSHRSSSCSSVSERSVSTKPWSSSAAHPDSQSDSGSAPMNEKSPAHATRRACLAGNDDAFEVVVAVEFGHLAAGRGHRSWMLLDAVDEVARHAHVEIRAPYDDRDMAPRLGQEQRRLTGRVSSPTTTTGAVAQSRASMSVAA